MGTRTVFSSLPLCMSYSTRYLTGADTDVPAPRPLLPSEPPDGRPNGERGASGPVSAVRLSAVGEEDVDVLARCLEGTLICFKVTGVPRAVCQREAAIDCGPWAKVFASRGRSDLRNVSLVPPVLRVRGEPTHTRKTADVDDERLLCWVSFCSISGTPSVP